MRFAFLTSADELARHAQQWDRLSGEVPFRTWTWLMGWWRHYGPPAGGGAPQPALFVPCVLDEMEKLVAALPCYCVGCRSHGAVLRLLGSGEVCSDYVGLLCDPHRVEPATEILADWLTRPGRHGGAPRWDALEFDSLDARDAPTRRLVEQLSARGCGVDRRPAPRCWTVPLPARWEEYLTRLSKSHRKQVRRLERDLFKTGRAVLRTVRQVGQIRQAMEQLVDLHQRRRGALGQIGAFTSPRFSAFHGDVVAPLLREGRLQLHSLDLDGRPAAADYHLSGAGMVYVYQGGMAPELASASPGTLMTIATLRRAIEQGYRAFDFLRGDEPYKAHWRAEPHACDNVRVVANGTGARLRHRVWLAGRNLRSWLKAAAVSQ